jgi:hypothetical protein
VMWMLVFVVVTGFRVYLGKGGDEMSDKYSLNVVKYLALPYQHTHRVIAFDNWFTSITLANTLLKELGLYCLGTIIANRKGLPRSLLYENPPPLAEKKTSWKSDKEEKVEQPDLKKRSWEKFEYHSRYEKNGSLVTTAWFDSKLVLYLYNHLSASQATTTTTVTRKSKDDPTQRVDVEVPQVVGDYQNSMGGVDRSDQACSYYAPSFRSRRFYIAIFYHLFNLVCIVLSILASC